MRRAWLLSVTLAMTFTMTLLTGCGQGEFADLREFMKTTGESGKHTLEPLPAVKPMDPFTYEASALPDPFRPRNLIPSKGGGGNQPDLARPKAYLEQFPLDAMHMVGTLRKAGQLYALIKTPENVVRPAKKGEYIGQNYGIIIAISETGLEIKESVQDGAGDWIESKAMMALQE